MLRLSISKTITFDAFLEMILVFRIPVWEEYGRMWLILYEIPLDLLKICCTLHAHQWFLKGLGLYEVAQEYAQDDISIRELHILIEKEEYVPRPI